MCVSDSEVVAGGWAIALPPLSFELAGNFFSEIAAKFWELDYKNKPTSDHVRGKVSRRSADGARRS